MIDLSELRDLAQRAFPADQLLPDRQSCWMRIIEMGWPLLDLPTELGGLALGNEAVTLIHFELGRVLAPAPLLPALLALKAVSLASDLPDKEGWISRMCTGDYVAVPLLPARVKPDGRGGFSGTAAGVFEADMASHTLVLTPDVAMLVPLDAASVTITDRPVWDRSRRMSDIVLEGHQPEARHILARDDGARKLGYALSACAQLAIAADSLGGATAILEQTIGYLKMRQQFERPLALFQAIKHRCADLKVQLATAEALLWSRSRLEGNPLIEIGALKAFATIVYKYATEEAIQLHGGIGLTEEHHCHLFMKRAMLNLQLCESADTLFERSGQIALAECAA